MNKIKQFVSVTQHLFSPNRRNKVRIIAKEKLKGIPFIFINLFKRTGQLSADTTTHTWQYNETRKIDTDYFALGTAPVIEDQVLDKDSVYTEHEYQIQRLSSASVYTNETTHRSIFNSAGERVEMLSSARLSVASKFLVPSKRQLPVSREIKGVTANLYGAIASAEGNYLHWFVDTLARLFLIERFYSIEEIDYVLVPPLKYDFHWDSLEAFGFDRSKIVELHPLECIQFETLLASNQPRGKGSAICPGWIIERYKSALLEKAKDTKSVTGKKVYVSRRDAPTRMFTNEAEVCEFLENRGFDIVELTPLNLWEKIAVFRDADVLISQTGAGLTNLMFCHSDVKVLELVDEKFVYPMYASMAVYAGGEFTAHFFNDDNALGRVNAMVAKSTLDIGDLEKSLVQLGC